MRIRVRGWHSKMQRMFSPEQMAKDQLTLLPTGEFINVNGQSTSLSTIYPIDKFIPLLSTGLHDKNGKEIYEGDVCLCTEGFAHRGFAHRRPYTYKGTVTFGHNDMYWPTGAHEVAYAIGWYLKGADIPLLESGDEVQFEVIGNIYENPELLEGE